MTTTHTPSTPPTDDDLRALLAPLAATEPAAAERAALRRAAVAAPRQGLSWRPVAVLGAATAAAGIAFAVLPGDDHQAATGGAGAAAFLHATAASADQAPAPPTSGAYRYTKARETVVYTSSDGTAASHHVQQVENWVTGAWDGRSVASAGRAWTTGDPAAAAKMPFGGGASPLDTPRDGAYMYGDGPLSGLDPASLPQDRDGIAAAIKARIATYGASATRPTDSLTASSIVNLLVAARLTPDQRAALLDVLAADPHAKDLGTVTDSDGRRGHGIELDYDGSQMLDGVDRLTVIFDADRGEVLQWSEGNAVTSRTETLLAAGYVAHVGDRP